MSFVAIFVRYRVFACMISAAIMLFGAIGLRDIGIDRMPSIDAPALDITTPYPGASPTIIDSSLTSVIESAINTVSGIDRVSSVSRPGASNIFVMFENGKDPATAFDEVQAKISLVLNELPKEAERPVVVKINPNATPVTRLFLTGDRPLSELNEIGRRIVKKSLESIAGVGEVSTGGGQERKIRIDLDIQSLAGLGLTVHEVMIAFEREHVQIPGGFLVEGSQEKLLHLDLEYHSIRELEELVVVSRSAIPVKLKDIAKLSDGLDDRRSLARFNGELGVAISVRKVTDANTVAVYQRVEQAIENAIKPELPDGVRLLTATTEADIIDDVVNGLKSHIVEGTLLACAIVFLFLLNIPATLIVATAVPISLAGAVVVMYFAGFTLNAMTLSALLILIGVVVDDAIVVLENIHRQHEAGVNDPVIAAITGTEQVILAVLAASLTIICTFGTVVFAEGMLAEFLKSFAIVISVGVATSFFVSITLTPALCSKYMTKQDNTKSGVLQKIDRGHQWLEKTYTELLTLSLSRRWPVMLISALIVASSVWFLGRLGAEFFPADDESRYLIQVETPIGSSIDYMEAKLEEIEAVLRRYPETHHFMATVGSLRSTDVNRAEIHVQLTERSKRDSSQAEIMQRTRNDLAHIAGIEVFVGMTPMFAAMGADVFEAYVSGPDFNSVAKYAEIIERKLNAHGGMGDLRMELDLARPQLSFHIDRNRARALGISAQQIGDTIRILAGGADIAKYNELPGDGSRFDVRMSALRSKMRSVQDLENVYLKSDSGELVRLAAVVDIRETSSPTVINRLDLKYSAGFFSNPEMDLGSAAGTFKSIADRELPPGYTTAFAGQAEELTKSNTTLLFIFSTGLLLVYMVLASQFNSLLQPILIMLAQPLAIVGGVFALWLMDYTLNIFTMVGLVLLIGLVSKNSILLVDLINKYRTEGMETERAIRLACPRRMRPVLMTSLTIVLAMLPAAMGVGAGSGQYGPLAVAVIGGVISSTLLTLIVVPVAYSLLERRISRTLPTH